MSRDKNITLSYSDKHFQKQNVFAFSRGLQCTSFTGTMFGVATVTSGTISQRYIIIHIATWRISTIYINITLLNQTKVLKLTDYFILELNNYLYL